MTQLDIDIIVHEEGKQPIVNVFKPDPEFPWNIDDNMRPKYNKNNVQGNMTVLNWKNTHFNLIVGPEHMLSLVGSISFQALSKTNTNLSPAPSVQAGVHAKEARAYGEKESGLEESSELPTNYTSKHRRGEVQTKDIKEEQYKAMLKEKDQEITLLRATIGEMQNKLNLLDDKYDTVDI